MATKTDFSSTEWDVLRDTPHFVVLAVAVAGGSGLFGSIAEAIAPSGTIIEALKGSNQLLKDVCEKAEMKASIESIKGLAKASGDFAVIQAALRKEATDKSTGRPRSFAAKRLARRYRCVQGIPYQARRQSCQCGEGRRIPGLRRRAGQRARADLAG